jgi:hypothetical protein
MPVICGFAYNLLLPRYKCDAEPRKEDPKDAASDALVMLIFLCL